MGTARHGTCTCSCGEHAAVTGTQGLEQNSDQMVIKLNNVQLLTRSFCFSYRFSSCYTLILYHDFSFLINNFVQCAAPLALVKT